MQAKAEQRANKQKGNDKLAKLVQAGERASETADSEQPRRAMANTGDQASARQSVSPVLDALQIDTAITPSTSSHVNDVEVQTPQAPHPPTKPTGIILFQCIHFSTVYN